MRCRECAAEVAVTARVCSGCGAPIVGQPPVIAETVVADTVVADTVVGAATRRLREGYKGTNVAGVVLVCASMLVGIFFIVGAVALIANDRDLAAHGVRTQGQVVEANADGWDKVVYTVGGTDYEVPEDPDVGDRLPGEAVTVVYDPRDPANSNLEDDSVTRHGHWFFLGFGLFLLGGPRCLLSWGPSKPTDRSAAGWRGRVPPDANRRRRPRHRARATANHRQPSRRHRSRICRVPAIGSLRSFGWCWLDTSVLLVACSLLHWPASRPHTRPRPHDDRLQP